MNNLNRYSQIIERIFLNRYKPGMREVLFEREDLVRVAQELRIRLPKNLGDIIYTFRYRGSLPDSIRTKAPQGEHWIIRPAGKARYCFSLTKQPVIQPSPMLAKTKIPDATPGVIAKYALSDEQALLARLRYNRLIDIFTGVTCYSLQNHLRTTVPMMGQVETDEIYVGIDRRGVHYVFPVQAKAGNEQLSIVQIEQDLALCRFKFSGLICRPIAAQFTHENVIALFELVESEGTVRVAVEKHYHLVPPEEVQQDDLKTYLSSSL